MKEVTGESTVLSESHAYLDTKQTKDSIGKSSYRSHPHSAHTVVEKRYHAVSELDEIELGLGMQ